MLNSILEAASLNTQNERIYRQTGRRWEEWFRLLDSTRPQWQSHQQITSHLLRRYQLTGRWSEIVARGYEQVHGLPAQQRCGEYYVIQRGKLVRASCYLLFKAWVDEELLACWLPGHRFFIRKAEPEEEMRITWSDGATGLVVSTADWGSEWSRVRVRHVKLSSAAEAEALGRFWAEALERLQAVLEK